MDKLINDINKEYIEILKLYIGNSTTYGSDLLKKGKKILGSNFKGVYSSDKIPNLKNGQMIIVNLDESNQPGSHWIGVMHHNDNNYVYDSFGRSSQKIIPSLGQGNIKDAQYDSEQRKQENNCGLRSLVALYMMNELDPDIVIKYL